MRYQSTIEVLERLGVGHANSATPSTPASYDKFLPYVFQTAIPGLSGVRQAQLNVFKAAVSNAHTDQQVDQAWNSWLKYLSSIEEPEYLALMTATTTTTRQHTAAGSESAHED